MPNNADDLFAEVSALVDLLAEENETYSGVLDLMARARGDVTISKKTLQKEIDVSWVDAIESTLPSLDVVIRNHGRDMEESEQVLPIELSRHISPRSLQHLGQHSDYIKEVKRDGSVIPSKLLNVFREETVATYENKFVNTLIDRLRRFILVRYDKLREAGSDEHGAEFKVHLDIPYKNGEMKLSLGLSSVERESNAEAQNEETPSTFARIERIKKIVDHYAASPLLQSLHGQFVRPPIMRTNAILKNQYLRQCLVLWQFIESYDKVGYKIETRETLEKPRKRFVRDAYSLLALQYLLFYGNMMSENDTTEIYRARENKKTIAPRFVRSFEDTLREDYDLHEVQNRSLAALFPAAAKKRLTPEQIAVKSAIDRALLAEKTRRASARKVTKKIGAQAKKA